MFRSTTSIAMWLCFTIRIPGLLYIVGVHTCWFYFCLENLQYYLLWKHRVLEKHGINGIQKSLRNLHEHFHSYIVVIHQSHITVHLKRPQYYSRIPSTFIFDCSRKKVSFFITSYWRIKSVADSGLRSLYKACKIYLLWNFQRLFYGFMFYTFEFIRLWNTMQIFAWATKLSPFAYLTTTW